MKKKIVFSIKSYGETREERKLRLENTRKTDTKVMRLKRGKGSYIRDREDYTKYTE